METYGYSTAKNGMFHGLLSLLRCKDVQRINMTFTYRVYYRDDSMWNYGKLRCKLVHARSKQQAMDKFYQRFRIKPLRAE